MIVHQLRLLLIISALFLSACTYTSLKPAADGPLNKISSEQERTAKIKNRVHWEIRGAIAVKNKSKGWSAALNWIQYGANFYQIRLMGPLGSGSLIISKKGQVITLKQGLKSSFFINEDQLLLEKTGLKLPVKNLYYWIRGLAAPGNSAVKRYDQYQRLLQLEQSGYLIDFTKYTTVKNIDLPCIIRLEKNGIRLKILIKSWVIYS